RSDGKPMKRLCRIYKGSKVDQMYLYVDASEGLARVPESLLATFGTLAQVMDLELHPARKLARADVNNVLQMIDQQGFYLQPPPRDAEPEAGMFPALQEHMDRTE